MILLNPGPVTLSPAVHAALAGPDLCHREAEFVALQQRVRDRLLDVYDLDPRTWTAALLAGSGTAAVEAMLGSLVPAAGRVLVIDNGPYGKRMSSIVTRLGIDHEIIAFSWAAPVVPADLERQLAASDGFTHVAVVHHETSTGLLNDLNAVAACCRSRGVQLLIDGVSSFGAEAIDFDTLPIAACAASANKCLHGAPGVAFVVARRAAIDAAADAARSVYLDIARHLYAQDAGSTAFTQPVHVLAALDCALGELHHDGGWRRRRERYVELGAAVRSGLAALDIVPLVPASRASAVLTAYALPEGVSYRALHDGLKRRGFIIYGGQGELSQRIFRIATMGEITSSDIDRLLCATAEVLAESAAVAGGPSPASESSPSGTA